jgi:hypothetical protein
MQRILDGLAFAHPYIVGLSLLLVVCLASGCATTGGDTAGSTRNFVTTGATTAVGAYIGSKQGSDPGRGSAIGAAAGYVVGETINFLNNKAQREAYLAGYEKGQSNAVKQQYWVARDNQRPSLDDHYEEGYYEIEVPATDREGVRREPTKRVIRVVMPREDES